MFPAAVYATPRASCFVNDLPVEIRRISAGASICIPVPSAGARLVVARRHPGGRWNVDDFGAVDRVARPRLKQPREKKQEERRRERGRTRGREKKEKRRVGFVGERKEGKRDREKRAFRGMLEAGGAPASTGGPPWSASCRVSLLGSGPISVDPRMPRSF